MADFKRLLENFENVEQPKLCKRTGTLPDWLKGTMVRNGPGMFQTGDTKYKHWFDGMAYIQRYHFKDGEMYYSAKYLESETYKANEAAQRIVRSQFGTFRYSDPCKTLFQRFFSFFHGGEPVGDNCVVAFSAIGDSVYALTELPKMIRIDMDTLDNLETVDVSKYLSLNTYTAHHHADYEGNIYNIGTQFGRHNNYVFAKTTNPLNIEGASSPHSIEGTSLIGTLEASAKGPGYYHSFGMSENYMILFESPLRLSATKLLLRNFTSCSFRDAMTWDDSLGTNVLILDKNTGKQLDLKIKSDSFFTFHHANSFEKDGFLVFDYCRMRNPGTFEALELETMRNNGFRMENCDMNPYLHRMVVPLSIPEGAKTGDNLLDKCPLAGECTAILNEDRSITVTDRRVCEQSFEFPRYNYESFNMKEYRYVYGSDILSTGAGTLVGVVKADTQTGTHLTWKKESITQLCAEPIFVPDPEGKEEDDGILIVPVITSEDGENPYVVVLNSKDLSEMARFVINESRIPLGFHALYAHRTEKLQ